MTNEARSSVVHSAVSFIAECVRSSHAFSSNETRAAAMMADRSPATNVTDGVRQPHHATAEAADRGGVARRQS